MLPLHHEPIGVKTPRIIPYPPAPVNTKLLPRLSPAVCRRRGVEEPIYIAPKERQNVAYATTPCHSSAPAPLPTLHTGTSRPPHSKSVIRVSLPSPRPQIVQVQDGLYLFSTESYSPIRRIHWDDNKELRVEGARFASSSMRCQMERRHLRVASASSGDFAPDLSKASFRI